MSGTSQSDIEPLRTKLGLLAIRDTNDRFDHTANIVIGNEATGQWIRHSAFENPQFLGDDPRLAQELVGGQAGEELRGGATRRPHEKGRISSRCGALPATPAEVAIGWGQISST